MKKELLIEVLSHHGLKVTPQRIAVLEALHALHTHPTAEEVIAYIKTHHPSIAIGTVYSTLDTFTKLGMVSKVKSERDAMRYDAVTETHHHLHCAETDRIEDYFDEDLNALLHEYFTKKRIRNFRVADIRLHITGTFTGTRRT